MLARSKTFIYDRAGNLAAQAIDMRRIQVLLQCGATVTLRIHFERMCD